MHIIQRSEKEGRVRASARRCRAGRVSLRFGVFSPGLYHNVRLAPGDDVAGRSSFRVGRKAADVVFVAMRGDDGVKLALTFLFDVAGNAQHQVFRRNLRLRGAAEVYQDVAVFYLAAFELVLKLEQEAITEADLIGA